MPKMNDGLTYWTVDEVAECLPLSKSLGVKLWWFLDQSENRTPLGDDVYETPDVRLDESSGDKLGHHWSKLSEAEQMEINKAYEAEYGR